LHISSRFEVLKRLERICAICGFTWGARLRYGWTGREYDAETGLYFHRARSYSAVQHRFTQEDPLGYAGGANLFAYVGGSPLERRDPSGLDYVNVCGWQGYRYYWRSGRITHGYEFECHDLWVPEATGGKGGGGGDGATGPGPSAPSPIAPLEPEICDTIRNSPGFQQTVHDLREAQAQAVAGGLSYLPETGGATDADFNLIEPIRIGLPGFVKDTTLHLDPNCPQCATHVHTVNEGHVNFADPPMPDGTAWLVHLHLKHVQLNTFDVGGFDRSDATTGVISILDDGFNVVTRGQTDLDQVHCSLK
jgi:RHS repeat-associated protein